MDHNQNQESVALSHNSLLILVGPSGSGKSTFAYKNFSNSMCVSTDECRRIICGSQFNQQVSDDAFDLFYAIIEKRLKNGYATIADSTALKRKYRQKLIAIAKKYEFSTTLMLFDLPLHACINQDKSRQRYSVGEQIIKQQFQNLQKTKSLLSSESYDKVVVCNSAQQIRSIHFRFTHPLVEKNDFGPFDLIGDVSGCFDELETLLSKLGYAKTMDGDYYHPERRKVVFLGNIMGQGPQNVRSMNLVHDMWKSNIAYYIPGSHCSKLYQLLKETTKDQQDLAETIAEILRASERQQKSFYNKFTEMYDAAAPYLILSDGFLIATHAGILGKWIGHTHKYVRNFCLNGSGNNNWVDEYNGKPYIVYGHSTTKVAAWRNKTININLGVVHGGQLCALRYPEKDIVTVNANAVYKKKYYR